MSEEQYKKVIDALVDFVLIKTFGNVIKIKLGPAFTSTL